MHLWGLRGCKQQRVIAKKHQWIAVLSMSISLSLENSKIESTEHDTNTASHFYCAFTGCTVEQLNDDEFVPHVIFHKVWEHHVIFALPINVHFNLPMLYFIKIVLYGFISSNNKSDCTLHNELRWTIMEQTCQLSLYISSSWYALHWDRAEFLMTGSFDHNID